MSPKQPSAFPRSSLEFAVDPSQFGIEPSEQISPSFIECSDGVMLAAYEFKPSFESEKVLIFLHDLGSYHTDETQDFAQRMVERHNIAVVLIEMRSHGLSGEGAVDRYTLLNDLDSISAVVRANYPSAELFLGGIGITCALLAHYTARIHHLYRGETPHNKESLTAEEVATSPSSKEIAGLVMISPHFGPFPHAIFALSTSSRPATVWPFKRVHFLNLALKSLTKGRWPMKACAWELASRNIATSEELQADEVIASDTMPSPHQGQEALWRQRRLKHKSKKLMTKSSFDTEWSYYLHTLAPERLLKAVACPIYSIASNKFDDAAYLRELLDKQQIPNIYTSALIEAETMSELLLTAPRIIAQSIALHTLEG